MSFLLDTCLISEFTRRHRDPGVHDWLSRQDEEDLFLSVVTVGELEKGLAALAESARKRRLREFIDHEIVERFRERTLGTDDQAWRRWGQLLGAAERKGKPLPVIDALIATLAQVHGLTVVTRNESDFRRFDVPVLNPWTGGVRPG